MFCNKARRVVKEVLKKITATIDTYSDVCLNITTGIQTVLKSPVADVALVLIPGDVDQYIRTKALAALESAVDCLQVVNSCKECTTLTAKLQCWMDMLKGMPPSVQESLLVKLFSLTLKLMDNNELRQNEYDLIAQAKVSIKIAA